MKTFLLLLLLSTPFFIFGQVQIGQVIYGESAFDFTGHSVILSADGSVMAVGAPFSGNGTFTGHVRIYGNQSGTWTQIGNNIDAEAAGDRSGTSISLSADGSVIAIGAPDNDGNGASSGHVRIYGNQSGTWTQIGSDIYGAAIDDSLGLSVSLSEDGSKIAIGATGNGSSGAAIGNVRVYDLSSLLSSDEFVLSNFYLFPNPAKTQFTIKMNHGIVLENTTIYNSLGQLISLVQDTVIDTSELSAGLYYVEVITNKGKATKKLVIE